MDFKTVEASLYVKELKKKKKKSNLVYYLATILQLASLSGASRK